MSPLNIFHNSTVRISLKKTQQPVIRCVLLFILFALTIPTVLQGQVVSDYPLQTVRGRLINARTKEPVSFAHVINKNTRAGVVSDSLGIFKISAHKNDTLYIKSINYHPLNLPVSDSLIGQLRIARISLTEHIYELSGIDLSDWGSYQEFKKKILNNTPPPPPKEPKETQEAINRSLAKEPKAPLQAQASIPLGSPITTLYMLVSKEGKSSRRLEAAKERNKDFLSTYQKFNREIVGDITGLTGDQLSLFMEFCKPDSDFLLNANDYDITLRVLQDFDRFKKEVLSPPRQMPDSLTQDTIKKQSQEPGQSGGLNF